MRNVSFFAVALVATIVCDSSRLAADSVPSDDRVVSNADRLMPRVRSSDSTIASLIAHGYARSPTFHRIVDIIDATNGIVYVEPGHCPHGVRACMAMSVTVAGGYRILRIVVDPRKATDWDLMALIGHELWHAVEVLRDPSLTSDMAVRLFYERVGHQPLPERHRKLWETEAAEQADRDVRTELRKYRKAMSNLIQPTRR